MLKKYAQENLIIQSILAIDQVTEKNYHCLKLFYHCFNCFEQCSDNLVGNFQLHSVAFSYQIR
jgi:hypothetical protein